MDDNRKPEQVGKWYEAQPPSWAIVGMSTAAISRFMLARLLWDGHNPEQFVMVQDELTVPLVGPFVTSNN